jgi:hypothetical protein
VWPAHATNYKYQLSPDYVGVELGIGESLLIKAIGESTGRSLSLIKADLKKEGDLGLVAMVGFRNLNLSVSFDNYLISRIPKTAKRLFSNQSV